MRTIIERYLPLYEQPGGGGGGGGGGGAGAGSGAGAAGASAFDAAALYSKFAVPDGMKGTNWEEATGKLYEGWKGLRDKTAAFAPPKDAASYTFEPGDPIKPYFKKGDDPIMSLARETAHKLGMPDTMFGPFINQLFGTAAEKGLLPQPYSPQKEIEAIGKLVAPQLAGPERDNAIKAAITEAEAFAPAFADHLKLSTPAKTLLGQLAQEAGGVELLRALKAANPNVSVQVGGQPQQQGYTRADYDKDVADPRYSPFSGKYDKAFREGVDAKARELFK